MALTLADQTFVAFDTETTGAYPIGYEICEIAGVKWKDGKVLDSFQSFIRPREPMSDFVIGIHGITNEMVADAPFASEVIPKFLNFMSGGVLLAHHAAFDLGFVMYETEKLSLSTPKELVLCTSLLSRKLFPESPNHRLQTLVEYFSLEKNTAHRALDDSKSCLEVGLRCLEKIGWDKTVADAISLQEKKMDWRRFSIFQLQEREVCNTIVAAITHKRRIQMSYRNAKDKREVFPIGVVRNPDGDYLVASEGDEPSKRFYLNRVVAAQQI